MFSRKVPYISFHPARHAQDSDYRSGYLPEGKRDARWRNDRALSTNGMARQVRGQTGGRRSSSCHEDSKLTAGREEASAGERLVDVINRRCATSQVCYHPQLGPIQDRDTCLVETLNGTLARACGTKRRLPARKCSPNRAVTPQAAQREAFDLDPGIVSSSTRTASTQQWQLRNWLITPHQAVAGGASKNTVPPQAPVDFTNPFYR